jgi:redox-sensitive bicupin YhaK (pirin superfamily)
MLKVRAANERGHFQNAWLNSYHSFSFGEYYDPAHMGVSTLRVINEDSVTPGAGFPTHGHRDMEIVSYVLEGELSHKDSMGNGSVIRPGDVQRMSAGTGVSHSEYNPSNSSGTRFLQIWLLPTERGIAPGYAQKHFTEAERGGRLKLLVSPDGREDSISANSDALMYGSILSPEDQASYTLPAGRQGYVQIARGRALVNGIPVEAGDGVTIRSEAEIHLGTDSTAEVLLFDLPA